MTLEKDKEDQSKYYLSYPKPPVLDMKWENMMLMLKHDINVVEWGNISNFLIRYIYNYFTSVCLPTHLGVHNIRATDVINNANVSLGTSSCKKMEHGNF